MENKDYLIFVCPGERELWDRYSADCDIIELEDMSSGKGFFIPKEYIDVKAAISSNVESQWKAVEDALQLGYEYDDEIVAISP